METQVKSCKWNKDTTRELLDCILESIIIPPHSQAFVSISWKAYPSFRARQIITRTRIGASLLLTEASAVLCHVCVHSRDALSIQSPSHYASNWACPELIYEILTHCLSGVTLYRDDPRSFPWYLGHICQSWRSVFVSSPRFWDRFSFETHSMEEISLLQRTLALVELCIERTKDRPFSFDFRVSRIYDRRRHSTVTTFAGNSSCPCRSLARRVPHNRYQSTKAADHIRLDHAHTIGCR